MPELLAPLHEWARKTIDRRLNGLLLNWYDAAHKHYIGKHRDSNAHRVEGTDIVTVSLGATRIFRMRPWREKGFIDFSAENGTVFIMPWDTNLAWTHEVPHRARDEGRRISITLRAFR